ncbi:piggyBac transposable element-derived protein 4-like [Procambarus clarkii]|uniref:piggyBac transposable element-derived protein 4-like n=1 Tax=Procambarus clarkii TaxID=6728 RepID=UPI003743B81A
MSDASSTSSRSTATRGHGKRLSEEEIRDILYDDGAMDDHLDYDPEKDLTQRSDTSEGETEMDDVASVYDTRSSPGLSRRPGSTPLSSPPSCMSPDPSSLFSDSTCDEPLSGFNDIGSDTSRVDDPSTSSGGGTRRGFAASATCRGKPQHVSQHEDTLFPYTGDDMADMEYFQAYFDNVFMTHLVTETNTYAHTFIDGGILPASRPTRWKDTTIDEMYIFSHYDRFLLILRCLHFENNANEDRHDRLWKVRKVFSDLQGKFRDYFVPGQNVIIDESPELFKGRLAFKQYIPSKRHRFGLKFFVLCDCETGIVLDMILYSDTDVDIPAQDEHGFSGSVVKTLMELLLSKGHILFTDNYYTCPLLTRSLLAHNTGVFGTVKLLRKEMPVFGIGIGVGECQLRKCDNMLTVRWKDRRKVNMLTTIHTGVTWDTGKVHFQTRNPMYKPDCVIDYNVNMRLVDKCDMMLGGVECVRRSVKWTKKFFFHLMDVAVLNCFNAYVVKSRTKQSIRSFSASVVTAAGKVWQ